MHQVQLSAEVYEQASRWAAAAGFASVDEYVSNVLTQGFVDPGDDLDRFFTADRLSKIDRAIAQIDAGQSFTVDQVREHFRLKQSS
jgi:hypothetical protein